MKDRLLTLGLAIAAFAAFYVLMAPKPTEPQEKPTRPTSIESGPNGYLGLLRWLTAERVPVLSLRDRYTKLQQLPDLDAESGNLMLTTAPQLYPLRQSEVGPLRSWVNQGNTLLIVAGLSDTPDWSMGEGIDADFIENLGAMTDLRFEQVPPPGEADPKDAKDPKAEQAGDAPEREPTIREAVAAATKYDQPMRFEMKPAGPHPLLEGVEMVGALSEYPSLKWRAWLEGEGEAVVELAHDPALP